MIHRLAIGFLCAIGLVGAIGRAVDVVGVMGSGARAGDLGPLGRANLERFIAWAEVPSGIERDEIRARFRDAMGKFSIYPIVTLTHVVSGALILVIAPLQFSRRVRARHPRVHRITGRFLLVLAAAAGFTGLFFGLLVPYGGAYETSAVAVFGTFFLFAAARAYAAARRRDFATHREWMIRMFAAALAVAVMRVIAFGALFAGAGAYVLLNRNAAGLNMWVGWLLTLAVAELWIRHARAGRTQAGLIGTRTT